MNRHDIKAIVQCLPHQRGRLTKRQGEVVWRIVTGLKDEAIAFELGLGVTTVQMHIRAAKDATGTDCRTALALWWVAQNLLEATGSQDAETCED